MPLRVLAPTLTVELPRTDEQGREEGGVRKLCL
jgi:hypothetical protein